MKAGLVAIFLVKVILSLVKLKSQNEKMKKILVFAEFLNNFSNDLIRYKHPVNGTILNTDGKPSSNCDEGASLTLLFKVLISGDAKKALSDHGIQKYCDEISKVKELKSEEKVIQ